MGSSHSVYNTLETVLKQRDIKVGSRTLCNFIKEVDRVAPWFAVSGSFSLPSWNKLGKDLTAAQKQKDLRMGMLAIWKLVRNCLQDDSCRAAIRAGQSMFEAVQDSLSETERSERLGAKKKMSTQKKERKKDLPGKGEERKKDPPVKEEPHSGSRLYPSLAELSLTDHSDADSEGELTDPENLDPGAEAELEEEAAQYESERYHPGGFRDAASQWGPAPSAPPPPYAPPCSKTGSLFRIPAGVRRQLTQAFPVFETEGGGRVHAPVEFNQLKELAESVRKYGTSANFTLIQLERLAGHALTPADWQIVVQAALPSMGQYMEWKALWQEAAQNQARINATALTPEQREWTADLLTGQGVYAANQNDYHWGAYPQVAAAAIKAWKALSKKGEANTQLSKIIQGPQEPFSDFVARMTEAATRIFGDTGPVEPLIQQLVFEQATQECRSAIAPRKNKGLQDWLRVCREFGGPLTNAGLAAAILQSHKKQTKEQRLCFKCGKPGHLKRQCPNAAVETRLPAQLCARCGKGYHRAAVCKSIRDATGRLLPPLPQNESKNGQRGPRTQGPQRYGTNWMRQGEGDSQAEAAQGALSTWTSTPPPTSY